MLMAAAASPGRCAVEPTPLVALSSLILAHGRPHTSCERVPAGPGSSAFGAGFGLSRLSRTFRRAEKVVARPPPTEVSNLNTPSRWRRRGTSRGYDIRVCAGRGGVFCFLLAFHFVLDSKYLVAMNKKGFLWGVSCLFLREHT